MPGNGRGAGIAENPANRGGGLCNPPPPSLAPGNPGHNPKRPQAEQTTQDLRGVRRHRRSQGPVPQTLPAPPPDTESAEVHPRILHGPPPTGGQAVLPAPHTLHRRRLPRTLQGQETVPDPLPHHIPGTKEQERQGEDQISRLRPARAPAVPGYRRRPPPGGQRKRRQRPDLPSWAAQPHRYTSRPAASPQRPRTSRTAPTR